MTRFITVLFLALTCVPALAQRYPPGGGGGCATYANQAALPLSAIDGTCAVTLDADTMWVYNLSGAAWKVIGTGGSTVTSVAFGSAPNANGGSIAANVLTLQPADGTHPGGVSIASQSFAGNKTFTGTIGASNLSGTNTGDVSLAAFGSTPNANGLSLSSQAINLQPADSTHPGGLLAADWNTFNSKQAALSFGALSDVGTDGIVVTGGSGAVIGSGTSLAQHVADATHNGYLLAADWSTFNGKQSSGNYITALTGDVTASGPGSVAASLVATSNATLATLSGLTTASSLVSVGTITSGTWGGTSVAVNHGGTGVATLTNHGVLVGAGTSNVTQLAAAAAGSVLTGQGSSADPSFSATPTLGVAGTTTGNLAFAGSTSGTITLKPQVAAGTWEWDFPITAGNAGQVLTSQGGAGTAMTWTAALTNPMTTQGDMIVAGSAGAAARLAGGVSDGKVVTYNAADTNKISWVTDSAVKNLGLATSVATSALTVALKDGGGNDASSTSPVIIPFRNLTAATGQYSNIAVTAALSIVVSANATLGQTSAVNQYVWVYLLNDAGSVDICVSGDWVPTFDDTTPQSVTQISAGATSAGVIYCASAHTGAKAIRLVGQLIVNEATAGTWASNATQIALLPTPKYNQGPITAFTGSWIGAVNPVFGTHTENSWWRREGRMMRVHVNLNQTATTGSTGGTAPFRMTVPNSSTIDSTWQGSSTSTPWPGLSVGSGALDCGGSVIGSVPVVVYDSTHITILEGGAETLFNCSPASHTNVNVAMEAWVPIVGWSEYGP